MSKLYRIVCLPGDGIGPEITTQALRVLERVAALEGFEIEIETQLIGGHAIDMTGTPLPQATLDACTRAHAVLLGAVGGPKWDEHPPECRPEKGLLAIRKALGLYNNLRPVTVYEPLIEASTLKPEVVRGTDLLVVRELTGGIYFGQPRHTRELDGKRIAVDTLVYDETEIRRIAIAGFEAARGRRKHLTSVDKANVLDSSRLWRKVVNEVAEAYPDVKLEHLLVDNCAMQLIRNPRQFDVIVTENMFGDILSDEASMLSGSIGMLSSASLGEGTGLYEPAHGSAPDIAGKDIANPLATILSVALLLRYSLQEEPAARRIESAIGRVLEQGYRCADIRGDIQGNNQGDYQGSILTEGNPVLGTTAMAEQVIRELSFEKP